MSLSTEALFTEALGLQAPWRVERTELNIAKRRIDFDFVWTGQRMTCPRCGVADQGIHERVRRSWRHLDFFQFEVRLNFDVTLVACSACGKTSQVPAPWAREGSGFTLLFEALALSLCKELQVAWAARHLTPDLKALWRRIEHYVKVPRAQDDISGVRHIGIDENSLRKGHEYVTPVPHVQQKRLLLVTEERDHQTVNAPAKDLAEHGGNAQAMSQVNMDMSAAYLKGVQQQLHQAVICCDRFHVAALAGKAMDEVCSAEFKSRPITMAQALGELDRSNRRSLSWAMRTQHAAWNDRRLQAMYTLQRTNLQSAWGWRKKVVLAQVYEAAANIHSEEVAEERLRGWTSWTSWASRSHLEPFNRMVRMLRAHFEGVIAVMQQGSSNALMEAMNGLMHNAKRAARGFRTSKKFIAIANLRLPSSSTCRPIRSSPQRQHHTLTTLRC